VTNPTGFYLQFYGAQPENEARFELDCPDCERKFTAVRTRPGWHLSEKWKAIK